MCCGALHGVDSVAIGLSALVRSKNGHELPVDTAVTVTIVSPFEILVSLDSCIVERRCNSQGEGCQADQQSEKMPHIFRKMVVWSICLSEVVPSLRLDTWKVCVLLYINRVFVDQQSSRAHTSGLVVLLAAQLPSERHIAIVQCAHRKDLSKPFCLSLGTEPCNSLKSPLPLGHGLTHLDLSLAAQAGHSLV